MSSLSPRQGVIKNLDDVFSKAANRKERDKRQEWVRDPLDLNNWTVPEWVLHERDAMIAAVNAERSKIGKPPIDPQEVFRVENCAKGHVDYQRKFVLYCTELVFDDWRGP